jgi:hypothetical protein
MSALMEKIEQFFSQMVYQFPWDLFPWALHLSLADRRVFVLEVLQAVQKRDGSQLEELLGEWQATAETLSNSQFMQVWQHLDTPQDDLPWEQVRAELDVPSHPQEGSA